jgi:hypothetical protein
MLAVHKSYTPTDVVPRDWSRPWPTLSRPSVRVVRTDVHIRALQPCVHVPILYLVYPLHTPTCTSHQPFMEKVGNVWSSLDGHASTVACRGIQVGIPLKMCSLGFQGQEFVLCRWSYMGTCGHH